MSRVIAGRIRGGDEKGAAAVLVAFTLPVLLGAAVLAVDAGVVWGVRRDVVTATDAAALAASRGYAAGSMGCAEADDLVGVNAEDARLDVCLVHPTPSGGYVYVRASSPATVAFGNALGLGDQTVSGASAARWGPLRSAWGLRPIAVCSEEPSVRSWLALGSQLEEPVTHVHRIAFTKESPDQCGSTAPGNWGWLDFDEGSNANTDLIDWLVEGYDASVGVNDCNGDGVEGDGCHSDPGSSGGSVARALDSLVESGAEIGIVIFDEVDGTGAGVRYRVLGFVGLVLRGYRVTGPEHARYLDVEFRRIILRGQCCDPDGLPAGAVGVALCGPDDPLMAARLCTA